ncbi:hypothetical protein [Sphingorhabdus sp.]|jgi:hypothetical protein|uniref:hypothetical protein n=1 Tax=Sphingorhabdus sp. TaxID=1902408 RepID=UPI002FDAEC42|nr:hypothetical protein [Sphingomonadaceae bacterium]
MSKIGDTIKTAADSAKDSLATAKAKTTQSTAAARAKASEAYEKGKGKTSDGIDKNPLAIVLGGIAIGAIVGALLPRTERETKVLGKAGKKLNKKARKMAEAAKAAGKDQVESLGLNGDALRLQFRDLVSKAALAVKAASQAATDAAKEK